MNDQMRAVLRRGVGTAVRMASCEDRTETWADERGGFDQQFFHLTVFKRDESVEPPPLTTVQQLALSVLVGEPIPPSVLLGALEDLGVYPDGVFAAAEEAANGPLDFGAPEYHDGESWRAGEDRFREVAYGWYRGQRAHVFGVCKGVFGSGNGTIGGLFGRFLDGWVGRRRPTGDESAWPTSDYLSARMKSFPPLSRVFRHLREADGPGPSTVAALDRLVSHLERK